MKRLMFAFVAAVMVAGSAAVIAGAPAVVSGDQDFTLVNKTGLTIDELYVSPTASTTGKKTCSASRLSRTAPRSISRSTATKTRVRGT